MDEQQLPRAYQLLGVKPGDTEAVLNKRFRRALFECHPDRPDGGDPQRAVALNQVHDTFKRNLVNGRIPGPLEMYQRVYGWPLPQQQRQVRVVRVIQFPMGGSGGWSTSTNASNATTTTYTTTFYGGTGSGW
jgi:hypothetical protein